MNILCLFFSSFTELKEFHKYIVITYLMVNDSIVFFMFTCILTHIECSL